MMKRIYLGRLVPRANTAVVALALLLLFGVLMTRHTQKPETMASQVPLQSGYSQDGAVLPVDVPTVSRKQQFGVTQSKNGSSLPAAVPSIPPAIATVTSEPTLLPALSPTPHPTYPVQIIGQRDFGAWSYTAIREENGLVNVEIRFDHQSVQGIRAFATANKTLAKQLASYKDLIEVEVTFRRPMDPAAYRAWAVAAGISYFDSVHIMAVEQLEGLSAQIAVYPQSTDPLPRAYFEEALRSTNKHRGPITIRGVDAFKGKVDGQQLTTLAADPQVFIVDVTANIVR